MQQDNILVGGGGGGGCGKGMRHPSWKVYQECNCHSVKRSDIKFLSKPDRGDLNLIGWFTSSDLGIRWDITED